MASRMYSEGETRKRLTIAAFSGIFSILYRGYHLFFPLSLTHILFFHFHSAVYGCIYSATFVIPCSTGPFEMPQHCTQTQYASMHACISVYALSFRWFMFSGSCLLRVAWQSSVAHAQVAMEWNSQRVTQLSKKGGRCKWSKIPIAPFGDFHSFSLLCGYSQCTYALALGRSGRLDRGLARSCLVFRVSSAPCIKSKGLTTFRLSFCRTTTQSEKKTYYPY